MRKLRLWGYMVYQGHTGAWDQVGTPRSHRCMGLSWDVNLGITPRPTIFLDSGLWEVI